MAHLCPTQNARLLARALHSQAMMEPTVKPWMTGDPVSVEPDASALEALDLMVDRGIRHLPVLDAQRRVVGVLAVDVTTEDPDA